MLPFSRKCKQAGFKTSSLPYNHGLRTNLKAPYYYRSNLSVS